MEPRWEACFGNANVRFISGFVLIGKKIALIFVGNQPIFT